MGPIEILWIAFAPGSVSALTIITLLVLLFERKKKEAKFKANNGPS